MSNDLWSKRFTATLKVTSSLFLRGCRSSEVRSRLSPARLSGAYLAAPPSGVQIHSNLLRLRYSSRQTARRSAGDLHGGAPALTVPSVSSRRVRPREVIQKEHQKNPNGSIQIYTGVNALIISAHTLASWNAILLSASAAARAR